MGVRSVEVRVAVDANAVGRGVNKATRELARLQASTSGAGRAFGALGRAAKIGAAVGLLAVAETLHVGFERLKEQQRASALTEVALKNLGKSAAVTAKEVEETAGSLALSTGVAKETIQAAENMALSFKTVGTNAELFKRLTTDALDVSARTGKSMTLVTRALGRAMDDPIKGMGLLARSGVYLTAAQRDSIKAMVEHNKVAQAQSFILSAVESKSKGAAAAVGNTLTGRVARAKEAFGQMAEEVTASLAPALLALAPPIMSAFRAIMPIVKQFAEALSKVANDLMSNPGIREFGQQIRDLAVSAIGFLIGALEGVLPAVGAVAGALGGMLSAVTSNAGAMFVLASALGALALGAIVTRVVALVAAMRELAIVQGLVSGFSALSTAVTGFGSAAAIMVRGLAGASAASVGLAPGLTAISAASGMASTAASGLGASLMAAAGGPIGVAVLAVGAIAGAVIALSSGMFSGESAAEAYARAIDDSAKAADGAKTAIDDLASSITGAARAHMDVKDAQARVVQTTQALAAATAQYGRNSPQYTQALAAQRRSLIDLSDAKQRAITADNRQVSSTTAFRQKLSELPGKIAAVNNAFGAQQRAGALAGGMIDGSRQKYNDLVKAYAQHLKAPDELRKVQVEALRQADALKGNLSPAAGSARKALIALGTAKIDKSGSIAGLQGLIDAAVTKLDALKTKSGAAKSKTNSNMAGIGNVSGAVNSNMQNVLSAVQTIGEQIVSSATNTHDKANAQLSNIGAHSIPVAPTVRKNMENVHDAVRGGGLMIENAARRTHDKANAQFLKIAALTRKILNAGNDKQDKARNERFGSAFRDVAPDISSRLSADTFRRTKGTSGNNGISLVKSNFSKLQDELEGALAGIDSTLNSALKSIDTNLTAQGDAIDKALKGTLVDGLDAIIPAYADKVRSIKAQSDVLTSLQNSMTDQEQALKNFDAAGSASDLASNLADAQTKLQEARDYGSPADVADAQKAVDDAQRAQTRADLQAAAEESRTQRDAEIATKQAQIEADADWVRNKITTDADDLRTAKQTKAEEDRVATQAIYDARRIEMEAELSRMEEQFGRIPELIKSKKAGARAELVKLHNMFKNWGEQAGTVYNDELDAALGKMGPTLAKRLAKEVKPYLELHSPAKEGPLSNLDEWFAPFVPTLISGIDTSELAATSDGIASMLAPSSGIAATRGGSTVINVTVNGNEFSAREFARKLQPELDRIVSYSGV